MDFIPSLPATECQWDGSSGVRVLRAVAALHTPGRSIYELTHRPPLRRGCIRHRAGSAALHVSAAVRVHAGAAPRRCIIAAVSSPVLPLRYEAVGFTWHCLCDESLRQLR